MISTSSERVLILGAGGMLGAAVYPAAVARYGRVLATDIDVNEPWLSYLDVRDSAALARVYATFAPTLVIHLAALTDLEYCERHPDETWATNALGTENAALLAERHDATFVYVGTAGIFDGRQERYTEFDEPAPTSRYARAKVYGEQFIERRLTKYFVVRAGWMMGGGVRKDKKFINKLYRQIKEGAREVFVVDDKFGAPTYTVDFADGMLRLVHSGYYGLYNQAGEGGGSRLDVAREFVRLLGLQGAVKVTAVTSDHFRREYYAPRPYSEQLVNLKLAQRGMPAMRDWKLALAEYSREFIADLRDDGLRRCTVRFADGA